MRIEDKDSILVSAQIGRMPRGSWRTAVRCSFGRPAVIATKPALEDETPFPTLFWLTCPWLVTSISHLESLGQIASWAERLRDDEGLRSKMMAADEEYRQLRAVEADGKDPFPAVGIAGQRDPLMTKCLHAHVAAALAGIDDPAGAGVLAMTERECSNDECLALLIDDTDGKA